MRIFHSNALLIFTLLFGAASAGASAAQDAEAGQKVFSTTCAVCHSVNLPPQNSIGPSLAGVVGRKAGTAPGFRYSSAMAGYGKVWSPVTLDAFIDNPVRTVPGTEMPYGGLHDATRRANLIAFLKQHK